MKTRKNYISVTSKDPTTYCMDVEGGVRRSNARLISYPCHGRSNQQFKYNRRTRQIQSKGTKKCLDVVKNRILQKMCNPRKRTQKWFYKNKRWVSAANHKCVDVEGGNWRNGSLITYPCHNRPNQRWGK